MLGLHQRTAHRNWTPAASQCEWASGVPGLDQSGKYESPKNERTYSEDHFKESFKLARSIIILPFLAIMTSSSSASRSRVIGISIPIGHEDPG